MINNRGEVYYVRSDFSDQCKKSFLVIDIDSLPSHPFYLFFFYNSTRSGPPFCSSTVMSVTCSLTTVRLNLTFLSRYQLLYSLEFIRVNSMKRKL